MAYRRRYLSGQAATTVVIAEGAVTSDKIVDKAVTQPKIDDDAVTTDKIATGAVQTEDIKDGDVKTADLGNGSVTTVKIADRAVTSAKLEEAIAGVSRPLTPGVATEEIANLAVTEGKLATNAVAAAKIKAGAVDATKLAGDAVETAKIKDENVTLAKMAAGSVDNTKLVANAVHGTELLDGVVSVDKLGNEAVETAKIKDGHVLAAKLGVDSVETVKILDEAVTDPKLFVAALAGRHIESFRVRESDAFGDFVGGALSSQWVSSGAAGGSVLPSTANSFEVITGSVDGNDQRVDFGGVLAHSTGSYPTLFSVLFRTRTGTSYVKIVVGLWKDANNHIVFEAEDLVGATAVWKARCTKAGATVLVSTGINIGVGGQALGFEILANDSVKFYVNGIEKVHIEDISKIPSVDAEPRIELITKTGTFRKQKIDAISVLTERTGYP